MAEAPAAEGRSPLKAITRKVGPLPLWAYAAIFVVLYFLYRRMKGTGSGTSGSAADTTQTADNTYVPGFDAAGAGGGGGIGSVGTPGVVNNYYYGDLAAQQANGGGTASIPPDEGGVMTPGGGISGGVLTPPHRVDPGPVYSRPIVQPYIAPSQIGNYSAPLYTGAYVPQSSVVRPPVGKAVAA